MNLGNSVETIVYCLLIKGVIYLNRRDEFPMVCALVCMIAYWIRSTMNHDIRLLIFMIHQTTLFH